MDLREGRCPKCEGDDVRTAASEVTTFGQPFQAFGAFMLHEPAVASLTVFICLSCGYTEFYMQDEKALKVAAEKWPKVGAPQR